METIKYVALGDSYTIGEGALPNEAWPNLIVDKLKSEGIAIELAANPSVTGWTSQQLIDHELPVFDKVSPDIVSILIGVNDWVQEVSIQDFISNFIKILDHVQTRLASHKKVLVINIPDFSVTPEGPKYNKGRDISQGLSEFNHQIQKVCGSRHITCVDLFTVSKEMQDTSELIADDGLHPSAKTYVRWAEVIYPAFKKMLV